MRGTIRSRAMRRARHLAPLPSPSRAPSVAAGRPACTRLVMESAAPRVIAPRVMVPSAERAVAVRCGRGRGREREAGAGWAGEMGGGLALVAGARGPSPQ